MLEGHILIFELIRRDRLGGQFIEIDTRTMNKENYIPQEYKKHMFKCVDLELLRSELLEDFPDGVGIYNIDMWDILGEVVKCDLVIHSNDIMVEMPIEEFLKKYSKEEDPEFVYTPYGFYAKEISCLKANIYFSNKVADRLERNPSIYFDIDQIPDELLGVLPKDFLREFQKLKDEGRLVLISR